MSDDEPTYDDAELAHATRLARALESRSDVHPHELESPRSKDAVTEAREAADLEAADLVRTLRAPLLPEDRAAAVLTRAQTEIERRRRASRWRVAAFASAGTLAVAAAMLLVVLRPSAPEATSLATSPSATPMAPSAAPTSPAAAPLSPSAAGASEQSAPELRAAQLAWLDTPTLELRASLEVALDAHRDAWLSELERRYAP